MIEQPFNAFFDPAILGTKGVCNGAEINGIFRRMLVEVSGEEGWYDTFECEAARAPWRGEILALRDEEYSVILNRPNPDNLGTALLILERL